MYLNYLCIYPINTFAQFQRKGFAKKLITEIEKLTKEDGYKYLIGEWSQEEKDYGLPRKLAISSGFRIMKDEDYIKTGYHCVYK